MAGTGRQTDHGTDGRDGSQAPWRQDLKLFTLCRAVSDLVVSRPETSTRSPWCFLDVVIKAHRCGIIR